MVGSDQTLRVWVVVRALLGSDQTFHVGTGTVGWEVRSDRDRCGLMEKVQRAVRCATCGCGGEEVDESCGCGADE